MDTVLVFQKNLELVNEAGKRMHALEQQRLQAKDGEEASVAASALAAEKAKHGAACVDLRKLAAKMGGKYQQHMENALATSQRGDITANTPRTLHIKSGKPVNMPSSAASAPPTWLELPSSAASANYLA